jgi:hypothetical protein
MPLSTRAVAINGRETGEAGDSIIEHAPHILPHQEMS